METAVMDQIERQKGPLLREAVALAARGDSATSLARLTEVREVTDDHERHRAIAADYARLPPEERSRTIVVAGTNEARREINRAVREDLGLAGHGLEYTTLSRRDTTQAERTFSKNYAPGDVLQPERDYPRVGLTRGATTPTPRRSTRARAPRPSASSSTRRPGAARPRRMSTTSRSAGRGRRRASIPTMLHGFREPSRESMPSTRRSTWSVPDAARHSALLIGNPVTQRSRR
jgi:hypothetical protein